MISHKIKKGIIFFSMFSSFFGPAQGDELARSCRAEVSNILPKFSINLRSPVNNPLVQRSQEAGDLTVEVLGRRRKISFVSDTESASYNVDYSNKPEIKYFYFLRIEVSEREMNDPNFESRLLNSLDKGERYFATGIKNTDRKYLASEGFLEIKFKKDSATARSNSYQEDIRSIPGRVFDAILKTWNVRIGDQVVAFGQLWSENGEILSRPKLTPIRQASNTQPAFDIRYSIAINRTASLPLNFVDGESHNVQLTFNIPRQRVLISEAMKDAALSLDLGSALNSLFNQRVVVAEAVLRDLFSQSPMGSVEQFAGTSLIKVSHLIDFWQQHGVSVEMVKAEDGGTNIRVSYDRQNPNMRDYDRYQDFQLVVESYLRQP